MIKVCYQKRGKNWYGTALKDNKVVATIFSGKELDMNRIFRRLPKDSSVEEVKEPDRRLADVLTLLEDVFNGKNKNSVGLDIDLGNVSSYA
ncbi:MAG: hypothetical protein NWF03_00875, partial [Candidatus Bathyarchaeota archaeon]|nr:hypothetical protein [Candidatus Bathyarchaeota archaeon]